MSSTYIKMNVIVHTEECYDDNNRRYVNSTVLRLDSIIGLSVGHGYVYVRLISGEDLRVEVSNSLCSNSEEYSDILLHRLSAVSSNN